MHQQRVGGLCGLVDLALALGPGGGKRAALCRGLLGFLGGVEPRGEAGEIGAGAKLLEQALLC